MPDSNEKLTGKAGLDTTDFKTGVAQMNRDIRSIESGFKASAAALQDWSHDATGLEARIKALTSEIQVQEKVVAANEAEYKRLVAAHGAESRAAQEQSIKLNQATERLNKMKTEAAGSEAALEKMKTGEEDAAGGAKELDKQSDNAGRQMNVMKGIVTGLKGVLGTLGAVARGAGAALKASFVGIMAVARMGALAVGGIVTAAIGAVAGLTTLGLRTAKTADDIDELSQKTHISRTALQELAFIGKQSGTDIDMMTGSLSRMVRAMDATKKYGSPAAQAFRELGVQTRDANGNLLDSQSTFFATLDALGKVDNEVERDVLAMTIFGKSAAELEPLMQLDRKGMAEMAAQAHAMGAVMSDEDVKAAAALNDKVDALKSGLQGMGNTLMIALVPALTMGADFLSGFVGRIANAITLFRAGNFTAATMIITNIVTELLGKLPDLVNTGLAILQAIIQGIIQAMPRLITAGIQIINSIIQSIVQFLPVLFEAGGQIILALITAISAALPQLFNIGILIVTKLVTTLASALPKMATAGIKIIAGLITAIIAALPGLISAGVTIVGTLISTIVTVLPMIFAAGGQIITALITGFLPMLPAILTQGMTLLTQLLQGITQALPLILPVIMSVIQNLIWVLVTNLPALINAGMQLLNALVMGISGALPALIPAIMALVEMIVLTLVQNLPLLVNASLFLIQALIVGISAALPQLMVFVPQILVAITTALVQALPMIWEAAKNIILAIGVGIANSIVLLNPAYQQIITSIKTFFVNSAKAFWAIGKYVVDGLWEGIRGQAAAFKAKITSFLQGIIDGVKKTLGIKSPSTVFAGIGSNMALGLQGGFESEIERVQRNIAAAVAGLAASGSLGINLAGGGSSVSNSESYQFYGPVTVVQPQGQGLGTSVQQAKRY